MTTPRFAWRAMTIEHIAARDREPGLPFPPHDPDYPDVNPATGDERETTEGEAE